MIKLTINPKIVINIIVVFIIISALLSSINIYYFFTYESITAEVVSVKTKTYDGVGADSQTSKAHYITYKYNYEGKDYEVTVQSLLKPDKNVGDKVILKCSPNNPEKIFDLQKTVFEILCTVFLCLFVFAVERSKNAV